ncbi:hypothetical protein Tco_0913290 [Tanacetum coccineum]
MENANPTSSTPNSEFLDPKKKLEIESWLKDSKIVEPLVSSDDVEYFDTFLTLKELRYHKWLLKYPKPSWVKAKVRTENLNNVKFSCMIGHFDKKQAYFDMESPINVMSRLHYNWIMSKELEARQKPSNPNFKDIDTNSIPPFVLENNDNHRKILLLVKSVISSMQVYWASVLAIPKGIILDIHQLIRGFLWCNGEYKCGKAKVAWSDICLPKSEGGLSLRSLEIFNMALMTTHIWNIVPNKESLWVRRIHTYKLRGRSFVIFP